MQTRSNHQVGSTGETGTIKSATRARQGVTGHNVRYVLVFGTVGVIVAFCAVYLAFFAG
jgi:hypothetical protein